ncbi:hypothetical protein [Arenimonas sp.]|uniref:hypothetical protein n=1 Tax=Arenimonas sp. TaxID=1872635 RepID=UPI0025B901B4|nr:hypothetical protein [Arenimonas sp.]
MSRNERNTGVSSVPARDVLVAWLITEMSRRHVGRANGITAESLARRVGINERMLRELITEARMQGIAIAGTPTSGYFVAATGAELEECCKFLRSRAMHSLVVEARLRKVALPELVGQLLINT